MEKYNEMSEQQNHKCKICGKIDEQNKQLCVDHYHSTGKIRGLLCHKCNRALGAFKDNIDIIENAIKYLKDTMERDSFDVI